MLIMTTVKPVRVRFAPSPTGPLHLGGVRTALYNYLFARQQRGVCILRIEDTDQQRFVEGAEQYIIESLHWCGIEFDEGVQSGGPYAPYRQSERSEIYREYIQILITSGHAYYAFDTPAELEQVRNEFQKVGSGLFQYNYSSRNRMKNSLSLPSKEVKELLENKVPYVIRIRIPENEEISFHDLIRGEVKVNTENLDDKVLFKSDGLPTYHLANVVDDYLMKITHVIRGEEWLPSAPLHLLLYRFLGWELSMPQFAHLPLILKPDGNGKLSKRDGDRLGFPVFPIAWEDPVSRDVFRGYREEGYLPEAFINMLALLGWNPGTEQELFSMDELISAFSIERIGKHGSKFDPEKARWFNHQYLSHKPDKELLDYLLIQLNHNGINAKEEKVLQVIPLIRERINFISDLWQQSWFFFQPPKTYDDQVRKKIWQSSTKELVSDFIQEVVRMDDFNKEALHDLIVEFTNLKQVKMGQLMNPLRLLVVGSNQGPGMMDLAAVLGKEEFLSRIHSGLEKINS